MSGSGPDRDLRDAAQLRKETPLSCGKTSRARPVATSIPYTFRSELSTNSHLLSGENATWPEVSPAEYSPSTCVRRSLPVRRCRPGRRVGRDP